MGWAGSSDTNLEDFRFGIQAHLRLKAAKTLAVDRYTLIVDIEVLLHMLDTINKVFHLRLTDLFIVRLFEKASVARLAARIDDDGNIAMFLSHVHLEEVPIGAVAAVIHAMATAKRPAVHIDQ